MQFKSYLHLFVYQRLRTYVENQQLLPDTQNGFRQGRSTIDNLYILNCAINQELSKPKGKLYAFFVDFTTAFDTVNRRVLWSVMQRMNIPFELITVIQKMYEHTAYSVGGQSFQSHIGVKQGCPLSPLLFALYIADLDKVLERNQLGGIVFGNTKVH